MLSKINKFRILLAACILTGTLNLCLATNYYVETSGAYTNDGLSAISAWPTIPYAIQNAADGDAINVGVGFFTSDWVNVYKELSIIGSDTYTASNPPLSRHSSQTHIWYHPPSIAQESSLLEIQTNNITIRNITFNGNFITNVAAGIFNEWANIRVEYCTFRNFQHVNGAYAILSIGASGITPRPDSMINHYNFNRFENIISTNATGIYLKYSPSIVANNDFSTITGAQSIAGIIIESCYLTNGSPMRTSIDSNYLYNCTQGIWGNDFADLTQVMNVRDNIITNCLIGIRITSADGPALITGNSIAVGGAAPTTNATPARGIWVQADSDPWNTAPTDHQIINNTIIDVSANTGTVGVLLEYDTTTHSNINSGVRATVYSNALSDFDIGLYVESGTNGIDNDHSPLVEVTARYNDIDGSETWAIQAVGMTNSVTATDNWLGEYSNPSNVVIGNINIANTSTSGSRYEDYDGDGTNDFLDVDDDNDLLADTNEITEGTSPLNMDTDFDGQNDWVEIQVTGTEPTNRASVFKMTVLTNTPGNFTLIWPGAINRIYNLYRTTNAAAGFGPVYTNLFGLNTTFTDISTTNSPQYFYKLEVTNTVPKY